MEAEKGVADYEKFCKIENAKGRSKFIFRGRRFMMTINDEHIDKERVEKFVAIWTTPKLKVLVKAFNETVIKTGYVHAHIVVLLKSSGKCSQVTLSSERKWKETRALFAKHNIKPISTDEHFRNSLDYDESKKKDKDYKELIMDTIGNWVPNIPFHEQVINFIKASTKWRQVLYSVEYGEYICQRLNWARQCYDCRTVPEFEWPSGVPLLWQEEIIAIIEKDVGNRVVHWIYDKGGCQGKSDVANWAEAHLDAFVIDGGKHSDIAYAYDGEPIVIFDMSRAKQDIFPYAVLESLKNHRIFSGKYGSCRKHFKVPTIWVLANFEPDTKQFSNDRLTMHILEDFKVTTLVNYDRIRMHKRLNEEIAKALKKHGKSAPQKATAEKNSGVSYKIQRPPSDLVISPSVPLWETLGEKENMFGYAEQPQNWFDNVKKAHFKKSQKQPFFGAFSGT